MFADLHLVIAHDTGPGGNAALAGYCQGTARRFDRRLRLRARRSWLKDQTMTPQQKRDWANAEHRTRLGSPVTVFDSLRFFGLRDQCGWCVP